MCAKHHDYGYASYGYDDDYEAEEEVEGYFKELLRTPAADDFTADQMGDPLREAAMRRDTGCFGYLLKLPLTLQLSPGKVEQIMGMGLPMKCISILLEKLPVTLLQNVLHLICSKAGTNPASAKQLTCSSTAKLASQITSRAAIPSLQHSTKRDLLKVAVYIPHSFRVRPVDIYGFSKEYAMDVVYQVLMGEMMVLRTRGVVYGEWGGCGDRRVVLSLQQAKELPVDKIEPLIEKAMMSNNWLAVLEVLKSLPAARQLAGSIVQQLVTFCQLVKSEQDRTQLQDVVIARVPAAVELINEACTATTLVS